jgi:uncharacterized membrane protein YoaT (DUF817 family)
MKSFMHQRFLSLHVLSCQLPEPYWVLVLSISLLFLSAWKHFFFQIYSWNLFKAKVFLFSSTLVRPRFASAKPLQIQKVLGSAKNMT